MRAAAAYLNVNDNDFWLNAVHGRSPAEAFDPKLDEALDKAVEAIRMRDQ